jgi:hypothetical protein
MLNCSVTITYVLDNKLQTRYEDWWSLLDWWLVFLCELMEDLPKLCSTYGRCKKLSKFLAWGATKWNCNLLKKRRIENTTWWWKLVELYYKKVQQGRKNWRNKVYKFQYNCYIPPVFFIFNFGDVAPLVIIQKNTWLHLATFKIWK